MSKYLVVPFGILVAGLFMVVSVSPVEAQDCTSTDQCDLGPTGYHIFGDGGGVYSCQWEGCHYINHFSGHCGDYHWFCGGPSEEDAQPEAVALKAALETGDERTILTALQRAHLAGVKEVKYNRTRGSWQIHDCNGSLVANFGLPADAAMPE